MISLCKTSSLSMHSGITRSLLDRALEFYFVRKKVFVLPAGKFDEQKRPAKVFGH
jgi:hypothetical protein